ncbi:MAG: hypothetical protein ACR2HR_03410 [Euzebya sp.]
MDGGGPGNRNDTIHYRDSTVEQRCQAHGRVLADHCIARFKDWQILRDHRRRGRHLLDSLRAVAYLHNLRILAAGL